MCMIVDMNVAHRVLLRTDDPDFQPIHKSLFDDQKIRGRLAYGGELLREYSRNNKVRRLVALLDRAGRATRIPDVPVDDETNRLIRSNACISNDAHIIALARVSHVRLLCSHDQDLHQDFTNKSLVDRPRGKVYQYAAHEPLINEFC